MNGAQVRRQQQVISEHVARLIEQATTLAEEYEIDRGLEQALRDVREKAFAVAEEAKP